MAKLLEERPINCTRLDELLEKISTDTAISVKPQNFRGLCTSCACVCATGPTGPGRYPTDKDEKVYKKA